MPEKTVRLCTNNKANLTKRTHHFPKPPNNLRNCYIILRMPGSGVPTFNPSAWEA